MDGIGWEGREGGRRRGEERRDGIYSLDCCWFCWFLINGWDGWAGRICSLLQTLKFFGLRAAVGVWWLGGLPTCSLPPLVEDWLLYPAKLALMVGKIMRKDQCRFCRLPETSIYRGKGTNHLPPFLIRNNPPHNPFHPTPFVVRLWF